LKENWRIAIAQINCTVGDLEGNSHKILVSAEKARALGTDIVVFPELAVTGYPPEDLLLKPKFVADNIGALNSLSKALNDIVAVVGFVDRKGSALYNAAAIVYGGRIHGTYRKMLLPNYGVFDEKRYFEAGTAIPVFRYGDLCFGVNICEDIWFPEGPTRAQARRGAKVILNINASPFHAGKVKVRERIIRRQVLENGLFVFYANLVGGQDELVFDGQSLVVDPEGRVLMRGLPFQEDLLVVDIDRRLVVCKGKGGSEAEQSRYVVVDKRPPDREQAPLRRVEAKPLKEIAEIFEALCMGLRDYVVKNGFQKVVIGLSGGVDSALVATIAVDCLGPENVITVFMPSPYTSRESEEDDRELAGNLGVELYSLPIDAIYQTYLVTLRPYFLGRATDITEENVQARIRGNLLMALSNKFGWLVLTTGNKSEMSVGYATLYGDMAGGFALIKDVPKTLVYRLCTYRNGLSPVIPRRILTKEPTAELKPDQKDSDTLPPYKELDSILKAYVEEDKSVGSMVAAGMDGGVIDRVVRMVELSEYKRRQAPPGIKITPKAFGKDRRVPITNRYRG
jgi:NAD+ synthase (glutamine-hydrolysing)